MKNCLSGIFLFVVLLSACHPEYKIPDSDLSLIPYKGNEVLIFKSSKGDTDTITLQGIETFTSWKDNWGILYSPNVEYKSISARISDWGNTNVKHVLYRDSAQLMVFKNDGETNLEPHFVVNDSWFYGDSSYTKKTLLSAKQITLKIDSRHYNDVVVLRPNRSVREKYNGVFADRPNTIYKLYWSLKDGIVRYDKKDMYWELIKKY